MVCLAFGSAVFKRARAASPRVRSRATNTRRAPMAASFSAATWPIPDVAPVITTTRPCMSGIAWRVYQKRGSRSREGGGRFYGTRSGPRRRAPPKTRRRGASSAEHEMNFPHSTIAGPIRAVKVDAETAVLLTFRVITRHWRRKRVTRLLRWASRLAGPEDSVGRDAITAGVARRARGTMAEFGGRSGFGTMGASTASTLGRSARVTYETGLR